MTSWYSVLLRTGTVVWSETKQSWFQVAWLLLKSVVYWLYVNRATIIAYQINAITITRRKFQNLLFPYGVCVRGGCQPYTLVWEYKVCTISLRAQGLRFYPLTKKWELDLFAVALKWTHGNSTRVCERKRSWLKDPHYKQKVSISGRIVEWVRVIEFVCCVWKWLSSSKLIYWKLFWLLFAIKFM